jgi:hypothetical protein
VAASNTQLLRLCIAAAVLAAAAGSVDTVLQPGGISKVLDESSAGQPVAQSKGRLLQPASTSGAGVLECGLSVVQFAAGMCRNEAGGAAGSTDGTSAAAAAESLQYALDVGSCCSLIAFAVWAEVILNRFQGTNSCQLAEFAEPYLMIEVLFHADIISALHRPAHSGLALLHLRLLQQPSRRCRKDAAHGRMSTLCHGM